MRPALRRPLRQFQLWAPRRLVRALRRILQRLRMASPSSCAQWARSQPTPRRPPGRLSHRPRRRRPHQVSPPCLQPSRAAGLQRRNPHHLRRGAPRLWCPRPRCLRRLRQKCLCHPRQRQRQQRRRAPSRSYSAPWRPQPQLRFRGHLRRRQPPIPARLAGLRSFSAVWRAVRSRPRKQPQFSRLLPSRSRRCPLQLRPSAIRLRAA